MLDLPYSKLEAIVFLDLKLAALTSNWHVKLLLGAVVCPIK